MLKYSIRQQNRNAVSLTLFKVFIQNGTETYFGISLYKIANTIGDAHQTNHHLLIDYQIWSN